MIRPLILVSFLFANQVLAEDRFDSYDVTPAKVFSADENPHKYEDIPIANASVFGLYKPNGRLSLLSNGTSIESSLASQDDAGYLILTNTMVGLFWGAGQLDWDTDNKWKVNCSKDEIYATITCVIARKTIYVSFDSDGYSVLIGEPDKLTLFRPAVVRVDKNPPLESRRRIFSGSQAKIIVDQFKAGDNAITRYSDYEDTYTDHVSLAGFSEAIKYMTWLKSNMTK